MALMALDCNAIWVWEMTEERSGSFMMLQILLQIYDFYGYVKSETKFQRAVKERNERVQYPGRMRW